MPGKAKKNNPVVFDVKSMGIPWLVDRIHVGTSDFAVAKDFAVRMKGKGFTREQRKAVMRYAIECHRENRKEYLEVMRGF